MWLHVSAGIEIMCCDGKGWRAAGSEKMPDNRLRQDINQISLGTMGLMTHTQCVFRGLPELQYLSHQVNDFRTQWEQKYAKVITRVE